MRLSMRSQRYLPGICFRDVFLLQRHVVNAETRRQCDVVGSAELDANGLTGKAAQVERPSQDINAGGAAILITERCECC